MTDGSALEFALAAPGNAELRYAAVGSDLV